MKKGVFSPKTPFFHFMPSPKFLKILQRIVLNHGNAHVKFFQWYFFGLGAIGKSLSQIRPIFHFPIIFLIILSHNLFSNVHVHMFIFSLTHVRLQLTLWVKFDFHMTFFASWPRPVNLDHARPWLCPRIGKWTPPPD